MITDATDDQTANSRRSEWTWIAPTEWREHHMRYLLIASVFAVAWASIGTTQAQVYPSRPITMVVPLPAGSAFDVTARVLSERMRISLGQSVIVENVTGAGGSSG